MTARTPPPEALALALRIVEASKRGGKYIPTPPFPKQQKFLALDDLEVCYGGAAGGAKTDALLRAALQYVHVPDYAAMLFRRTFTDLALEDAIMDRSHQWLDGTDARWNDRDKRWTFPSGATLSFGYMDGPRDHMRYKSAAFHFIGFDELTEFLKKQYVYMFSRLRRKRGGDAAGVPLRMRSATNPGDIGHDWVKERFGIPDDIDFDRVYECDARKFVPARLEDNPALDRVEYEKSLAELDQVTREQLRFGRWVRDASENVYKLGERCTVNALPALEYGDEWSYVLGLDYGVVDDTAYAVLAFSQHHPVVYCVDAGSWTGLSPSEAGAITRGLDEQYAFDRIVGDIGGLGKGFQKEARQRFYVPVEAAQKSNKLGYIRLLNDDLKSGKVLFLAGKADDTIDQMKKLVWSDETQTKEHPSLPNHRSDALLYAWREARHWAWEPKKQDHETRIREQARKNFAPGEEHEVEKWEREQRQTRRVSGMLRL